MGAELVELQLPARPDVLSLARLVVAAVVSIEPLFDEERIDDLRLALSEACTNAIDAQIRAGPPAVDEPITIRCSVDEGRAEIEVRDRGTGFDPGSLAPHPPVSDPARLDFERGLGIPLIRLLSDKVEFRPTPTGTYVTMTFDARPFPSDGLM
jgi:serine/threonine-protein kinase RsbW